LDFLDENGSNSTTSPAARETPQEVLYEEIEVSRSQYEHTTL